MRQSTLREVPRAAPRPLAERSAGIDHVQGSHRAQNRALSLRVPADLDHRGDRDHAAVARVEGFSPGRLYFFRAICRRSSAKVGARASLSPTVM